MDGKFSKSKIEIVLAGTLVLLTFVSIMFYKTLRSHTSTCVLQLLLILLLVIRLFDELSVIVDE